MWLIKLMWSHSRVIVHIIRSSCLMVDYYVVMIKVKTWVARALSLKTTNIPSIKHVCPRAHNSLYDSSMPNKTLKPLMHQVCQTSLASVSNSRRLLQRPNSCWTIQPYGMSRVNIPFKSCLQTYREQYFMKLVFFILMRKKQ